MPKEYVGPTASLSINNRYNYPTCKPECLSIINTGNIRAMSDYYISDNRCIRTTNFEPEASLVNVIGGTLPTNYPNFISCSDTTDTRYPAITGQYILIKPTNSITIQKSIPINSIILYNGTDIISTGAIIAMSGQFVNNTDISPFTVLNNTTNTPTNFVFPLSTDGFILIDLTEIKMIS